MNQMFKLLPLWIALSTAGCASLSSPKETVRSIFNEVKNHNYEKAQEIYSQSPSSSGFEVYVGGGAAYGTVKSEEIERLLGVGTSYMNICEGLVKEAKYNQSVSISDLKDQFESECEFKGKDYLKDDLVKIKQYSTVDLLAEAPHFKREFYKEITKLESKSAAQQNLEELATRDKATKAEAYENSPEFYSKKLCEMNDRIKLGNKVITKENEAGKISGYIDKKKLYEAGRIIQANQDNIKHFSSEYQTKFGKIWNTSECK
ncbi:MAG: hypothetical protein AB7O96_17640 [Pseudobdellovibrionaceae bacterium]